MDSAPLRCFTYIVFFLLFSTSVLCKYYMSLDGMRKLAEMERQLATDFLAYYNEESRKLDQIQSLIDDYDKQNEGNNGEYIQNPVDAYKFLTRFSNGWEKFDQLKRSKFEPESMKKYLEFIENAPTFKDHTEQWGSIYAIIKLQETYQMEVKEFTESYQNSQKLHLYDIFIIGYYAMTKGYYAISALWLEEAYSRWASGSETDLGQYNVSLLLQSVVWDYDQLGNYEKCAHFSEIMYNTDPDYPSAKSNRDWYKYLLTGDKADGPDLARPKKRVTERFGNLEDRPWLQRNNRLCRREEEMLQEDKDKLFCSYFTNNKPELLLKPLKREMLYLDPEVAYFHNLLDSNEVDHIVNHGTGYLKSAEVYNSQTGERSTADYRIGKSGWLMTDYIIYRIMLRVSYATGLNMMYSEPFQVMNYGVGGNYEAHYDHATPPNTYDIFKPYNWGNRIATALLYLSDVDKGGETVFTSTSPGVIANAVKGAGVIWYNLLRNGNSDDRTKHAGCPVLLGEKWVSNLWIHEWGQEFTRPCTLDPKQ